MIGAIGDIHLGAIDRTIKGAYLKVISTVDKVIENLKRKGCKTCVFLGDIFDKPTADDDMMIAFWAMLMKHKDMTFYSIIGNHDMANINQHSLKLTKWLGDIGALNITTFDKPTVKRIDGDKYLFCPHPHIIDAPRNVRYAFGHFGFNGATSDSGIHLKTKHEPNGRWVLGDYHTPQRGKTYHYAGSIVQVKFFESPEKGYIEIDDKDRFVSWKPDILLGKAVVNNLEELKALDSNTYWQAKFGASLDLPPDWAQKYPHIVEFTADKLPSKRAKVLMKRVATEDPLKDLEEFLRSRCGLSDKEIALGNSMLGRMV